MTPEAAIRQIVAEQAAAWNSGDGRGYAKHFAEHGSFTNVLGTTVFGHLEFEQRHVGILATFFKGSVLEEKIRRIQFVGPDVAIVDIDVVVRGVHGMPPAVSVSPEGVLQTRLMQVFVARAGLWWIEAHHNVDVKI
jgi:uncharacterized protein (TIGR02246 family)